MAEPNSSAVGGLAIATGAISLSGTIFGLQADALLFGLFGGLIWLAAGAPLTKWRAASVLATAVLFAGVGSPILVAWALDSFAFLAKVSPDVLGAGAAMALGFGAQMALDLATAKVRGLQPPAPPATPGGGA